MLSDCCGAVVRYQDICSRCGEHCEASSDDGYDAARDAYNMGYGLPVTRSQHEEDRQLREEYRRNGW